jgi:hypothetical protein
MAKVVGPLSSIEARGKVGPLVYNSWRGLHTVRSKVTPKTQNSTAQNAVQDNLHAVVKLWQDYGVAHWAAWELFGREHKETDWTGTARTLCGYSWFCRMNYWAHWYGWGNILVPPRKLYGAAISSADIIVNSGTINLDLTYTTEDSSTNWWCLIWHTTTSSPARHPTIIDAQFAWGLDLASLPWDISMSTTVYNHLWIILIHKPTGVKTLPFYARVAPYTP